MTNDEQVRDMLAELVQVPCPACQHLLCRPEGQWDGVCDCDGCGTTLVLTCRRDGEGGLVRTEWRADLADVEGMPDGWLVGSAVVRIEASGVPVSDAKAAAAAMLAAGFVTGWAVGTLGGWGQVIPWAVSGWCVAVLARDWWRRRGG